MESRLTVAVRLFETFTLRVHVYRKAFRFPEARKTLCVLSPPRTKKDQNSGLFLYVGAVVEEVRTVFERINDATIYIPGFEIVETV